MKAGLAAERSRANRSVIVALAVLAIELDCSLLMIRGAVTLPLCMHLAACTVLAAQSLRRDLPRTPATATVRITAMMLPFVGPVAAVACVVVLLTVAFRHDPAANAAHWHEHLFPNLAADDLSERAEAIVRQRTDPDAGAEIESFYDVLRWGSLAQQEHVLSMISRSFKPEFAPVLRAGLALEDIGLRAQAAAGLSLLEARTSNRLTELETEFRRSGDRKDALLLAQALADAAHSGIYDELRTDEMREQMVSILLPLTQGAETEPHVITMLGRTFVHLRKYDRAVATLERSERNEAALSWLLEAAFRQGDLARLTALLAARVDEVRTLARGDGPLSPALRFWVEGTC